MAQLKDLLVLGDCRIEGNVNFNNFNGTINGHSVESDVPSGATFMTAEDKAKLDGIEDNATNTTKQTVSDWGFYEKPTEGIPKTDLSSSVQTSIDDISSKANKSGDTFTGNITITRANTTGSSIGSIIALGNSKESGETDASYGVVRLYGDGAYYTNLCALPATTGNRTIYLPNTTNRVLATIPYNTTSQVPTAVGSTTTPVYVSASGNITACGDTIKAPILTTTSNSTGMVLVGKSVTGNNVERSGYINFYGSDFVKSSSKFLKENITDISEDEANKLLKLRPINFDYINGDSNKIGLIAEEVVKELPKCVSVPKEYNEDVFEYDYEKTFCDNAEKCPSIDYSSFVPYLIKMVQMQQEQINLLEEKINALEK